MDYASQDRMEAQVEVAALAVEERGLLAGNLCARCQSGHLYRRKAQLTIVVHCAKMERDVPSDIVECSKFEDVKAISLYDMQKLAILVDGRDGINGKAYL